MIVIVCGLPGAGKTTLATRLRARLRDRGYAFGLRHSDDYGRRTYERMYEDVAAAYERAGSDDARRNWILDGTFFEREWRNRFYRLDTAYEVWVRASISTCLERNRTREGSIPETGLRAIRARFEAPRADVEVDTDALDVEAALDRSEAAVVRWRENEEGSVAPRPDDGREGEGVRTSPREPRADSDLTR